MVYGNKLSSLCLHIRAESISFIVQVPAVHGGEIAHRDALDKLPCPAHVMLPEPGVYGKEGKVETVHCLC